MNTGDRADGQRDCALMDELGKQRYLALMAILTLDQYRVVAEHAALSYARGADAITRMVASADQLSAEDRAVIQTLKAQYAQVSLVTVAAIYEGLLGRLEQTLLRLDTMPTLPATTGGWNAFSRGVEEFIDGFSFGLIPAKHDDSSP